MGVRDEARQRTTAAIMAAARREVASGGGAGLSMRAIAREVGLVSSAVYRYFDSREALLTALVVESYHHLAAELASQRETSPSRWVVLGRALRAWALGQPHEFQLIYGTPIPGYQAPPETIAAAAAVAAPFLHAGAGAAQPGFTEPGDALAQLVSLVPGSEPSGAAAVLAELAALIGFVTLELGGHFVGTADPADPLYEALLARQAAALAPVPD